MVETGTNTWKDKTWNGSEYLSVAVTDDICITPPTAVVLSGTSAVSPIILIITIYIKLYSLIGVAVFMFVVEINVIDKSVANVVAVAMRVADK